MLFRSAYVFESNWRKAGGKETLDGWARELKSRRPEAKIVFTGDFLSVDGDATIDGVLLNDVGFSEGARACVAAISGGSKNRPAAEPPPVEPPPVKKEVAPVGESAPAKRTDDPLPGLEDLMKGTK